ncbi:DUF4398 domain-containing protein [Methanogenium cariaci]|uniref:DUF4398 domain-containing protein n=1 Tax=Methanogenium cariaci TaxID=2197 RepID=UPI001FDF414D|nr:DUF4398 domain-containing protein [Methanogenium cariaci]
MNLDIPPQLVPAVVCVMLLVIAGAGCMEEASIEKAETNPPTPTSEADDLLSQAEMAMGNSNYRTASSLYEEAYKFYTNSGDDTNALLARNGMFRATRAIIEYPHNRTAAGAAMQAAVPNLTETDMNAWLDGRAQTIESDGGEVLYFGDVAANFLYANVAYLRPITATMLDFGYISRYAIPEGASPPPVTVASSRTSTPPSATPAPKSWRCLSPSCRKRGRLPSGIPFRWRPNHSGTLWSRTFRIRNISSPGR